MKAMRLFADRDGKLHIGTGITLSEMSGKYDLLLGMKHRQRIIPFDKKNPPAVTKRNNPGNRPPSHLVYHFDLHMVQDQRVSKMCGQEVKYYLLQKAESEHDLRVCVLVDVIGSTNITYSSQLDLDDLPCGIRVDDQGQATSPVALIALTPGDYLAVEFGDAPRVTVRYDITKGLTIEQVAEPIAASME